MATKDPMARRIDQEAGSAAALGERVGRRRVPTDPGHEATGALTHRAQMLISGLPAGFRLHETRLLFPHVLDRIAAAWHDPKKLLRTIDECMLDERGGRQGFPFGVLREISALREHYFTQVHPELSSLADWTRL